MKIIKTDKAIKMLFAACVFACLVAASSGVALACRCLNKPEASNDVSQYAAVFAGRVKNVQPIDGEHRRVVFEVEKSWKGEARTQLVMTTGTTSCDFIFKRGVAYLVYATSGADGKLETNLCLRTARLVDAKEDLQALGAAKTTARAGRKNQATRRRPARI